MEISELIKLQDEFDREHFPACSSRNPITQNNLGALDSLLVAIHSETGEICGVAKKICSGETEFEQARHDLREELADALIYLLKACVQLDIDIETAILERVKHNRIRFAYRKESLIPASAESTGALEARARVFRDVLHGSQAAIEDLILRLASQLSRAPNAEDCIRDALSAAGVYGAPDTRQLYCCALAACIWPHAHEDIDNPTRPPDVQKLASVCWLLGISDKHVRNLATLAPVLEPLILKLVSHNGTVTKT